MLIIGAEEAEKRRQLVQPVSTEPEKGYVNKIKMEYTKNGFPVDRRRGIIYLHWRSINTLISVGMWRHTETGKAKLPIPSFCILTSFNSRPQAEWPLAVLPNEDMGRILILQIINALQQTVVLFPWSVTDYMNYNLQAVRDALLSAYHRYDVTPQIRKSTLGGHPNGPELDWYLIEA